MPVEGNAPYPRSRVPAFFEISFKLVVCDGNVRRTREECAETDTVGQGVAHDSAGAAEANLIRLGNEASMDNTLASLITYVQTHPHVVSVELQSSEIFRLVIYLSDNCQMQGTPLGICKGMPKSLSAIVKSPSHCIRPRFWRSRWSC